MSKTNWLVIAGCCIAPQFLWAAEQSDHQYTARDQIEFSPSTKVAFDRSGQLTTSRVLPDGSKITELNGSMRSVMVARMGPDGKIETFCTTNESEAKDWMAGLIDPAPAVINAPARQVKSP